VQRWGNSLAVRIPADLATACSIAEGSEVEVHQQGEALVLTPEQPLELIDPAIWPTRARARTATVHWLEAIYNRRRRHSAIDVLSPVDYEERYWDRRAAA
jgi:antitoxin component of MazEF toxin-antitoxin module